MDAGAKNWREMGKLMNDRECKWANEQLIILLDEWCSKLTAQLNQTINSIQIEDIQSNWLIKFV